MTWRKKKYANLLPLIFYWREENTQYQCTWAILSHLRKAGDGKHCVQLTVQRHGQTKILRSDYSTRVKLPLPPKLTTTLLKAYLQMLLLSSVAYPVNTQKQKENLLKGKTTDSRDKVSIRKRPQNGTDVGIIRPGI